MYRTGECRRCGRLDHCPPLYSTAAAGAKAGEANLRLACGGGLGLAGCAADFAARGPESLGSGARPLAGQGPKRQQMHQTEGHTPGKWCLAAVDGMRRIPGKHEKSTKKVTSTSDKRQVLAPFGPGRWEQETVHPHKPTGQRTTVQGGAGWEGPARRLDWIGIGFGGSRFVHNTELPLSCLVRQQRNTRREQHPGTVSRQQTTLEEPRREAQWQPR